MIIITRQQLFFRTAAVFVSVGKIKSADWFFDFIDSSLQIL